MAENVPEVDELGVLQTQLGPLLLRERELKDKIKSYGQPVVEGALFRATIVEQISERLDAKAVKAEMGPTWFSAHAKIVVGEALRLTAKTARQA